MTSDEICVGLSSSYRCGYVECNYLGQQSSKHKMDEHLKLCIATCQVVFIHLML